MAPPKENRFWMARSKHGRKKTLTPAQLKEAGREYFEWTLANPLITHKVTQFQGQQVDMQEKTPRIMTIAAFCRFAGIAQQTLLNWGKCDDYMGVVDDIRTEIYDYKLTGAAAGQFNASIISQELGLGTRVIVEEPEPLTPEQRRRKIAELLEKC